MPNDGGRLALAEAVLAAGFSDRLLLAQDICQKHRLAAFGGHGYDHLLRDVVPMLVARGHSQADVDRLVRENPARFLGWDQASRRSAPTTPSGRWSVSTPARARGGGGDVLAR